MKPYFTLSVRQIAGENRQTHKALWNTDIRQDLRL